MNPSERIRRLEAFRGEHNQALSDLPLWTSQCVRCKLPTSLLSQPRECMFYVNTLSCTSGPNMIIQVDGRSHGTYPFPSYNTIQSDSLQISFFGTCRKCYIVLVDHESLRSFQCLGPIKLRICTNVQKPPLSRLVSLTRPYLL